MLARHRPDPMQVRLTRLTMPRTAGDSTMKRLNRRQALGAVATTGVAALASSGAAAVPPAAKKRHPNLGPAAPGSTKPDSHGPRELFAVVDMDGNLKRRLHAVSSRQIELGVYEVL